MNHSIIALAGNPNCGKTALFNALTGGRQKVGNYPGVTVERKEGQFKADTGEMISILDLPGAYSLDARTPDESITRDILLGNLKNEKSPDLLIAVADATNLERNLGLILELKELKIPVILALNMMDIALKRGMKIDQSILEKELGITVIPTVAIKKNGIEELKSKITLKLSESNSPSKHAIPWLKPTAVEVRDRFKEVDRILKNSIHKKPEPTEWTDKIDSFVLHPFWGFLLLVCILSLIFQAIFSWAAIPQEWIKNLISVCADFISNNLSDGPLKSLLADGIIAGVGAVLVFLPQILILFLFILILEDSGYMSRAAFLMDKLMGKVGLHGRAFIPLLSSFACAIPGIMATRTIENKRDRLTTILIAPLTTCSARLPVYTLLISAFIPNTKIWGIFNLQGLVMMALYFAGISIALLIAIIFRKTIFRGPKPALIMEMPTYKWPSILNLFLGLKERAVIFIRRAGSVILAITVILWFLASYPKAPENSTEPKIFYSYAGQFGKAIEPIIKPLGFNWRIGIALVPGFAAREVMVGALATVYSIESENKEALGTQLQKDWSLATALSLMVWYIIALQCLSTIAVTKRETNSWRWPLFMLGYLTCFAYLASFFTYHFVTYLTKT